VGYQPYAGPTRERCVAKSFETSLSLELFSGHELILVAVNHIDTLLPTSCLFLDLLSVLRAGYLSVSLELPVSFTTMV
jgi:hypothetical protein